MAQGTQPGFGVEGGVVASGRVKGGAALAEGSMLRCIVDGLAVCLLRSDDGLLRAIDDTCSHEDASLADGWLDGTELECPRHNSIFDLLTGRPVSSATEALKIWTVVVDGDDVLLS